MVDCGITKYGGRVLIWLVTLPFDRRRHGTIIGMGACALVVESEDAVRERGMRGIAELLELPGSSGGAAGG